MSKEAQAILPDNKELQAQLVHDLVKKIKDGESREAALQGVPEELKKKIEEELDREKAVKEDKRPSNELIPTEFHGLTSRALNEQWIVEVNTPEGELEKNRKIAALEALKREEVELINERTKEIERAARVQSDAARIDQIRSEIKEEPVPHFEPIRISNEEITQLLSESTSRDSFREHLKHRYTEAMNRQQIDAAFLTRHHPNAVPDFMRQEMVEKYGRHE